MDWQPDQDHTGFDQFVEDLAYKIDAPVSAETQLKSAGKHLADTTSVKSTKSQNKARSETTGAKSCPKEVPAKHIIGQDDAPMVLI